MADEYEQNHIRGKKQSPNSLAPNKLFIFKYRFIFVQCMNQVTYLMSADINFGVIPEKKEGKV